MQKALTISAMVAVASAIKIQSTAQMMDSAKAEKFLALDDYSNYSRTEEEGNNIRAAGTLWSDPIFTPSDESLGIVTGDSANVEAGAQSNPVTWERLSNLYTADQMELFKHKDIFSSAQQGALGDCYFISAMI